MPLYYAPRHVVSSRGLEPNQWAPYRRHVSHASVAKCGELRPHYRVCHVLINACVTYQFIVP